jgi:hypothetical protein
MVPGAILPDCELSDHSAKRGKLSELQGQHPMILVLSRGGGMNCQEATNQRGDKHAERRIPWNGGPTLRRSGLAHRDRYGFGVAHRCRACANEEISIARLVPIRSRAPKPCRYPCGDGSLHFEFA